MSLCVQVSVVQARGLRSKGKNGTNDAYATLQLGRERFSTGLVERSAAPVWREQAEFPLLLPLLPPGAEPESEPEPHTDTDTVLRVQVLHRVPLGADKLLGQTHIDLTELHARTDRHDTQWYRLLGKSDRADKERGEVQLEVRFVRSSLSASMFDLSSQGASRSRVAKLRDKLRGKKREGLSDSASAVLPPVTQVMTDSEGEEEEQEEEEKKKKKNKLSSLFTSKSNLQRTSSRSTSTLTVPSETDPGVAQSPEGKKKFKFLTHKRTSSTDARASTAVSVCINGSHVYSNETQDTLSSTRERGSNQEQEEEERKREEREKQERAEEQRRRMEREKEGEQRRKEKEERERIREEEERTKRRIAEEERRKEDERKRAEEERSRAEARKKEEERKRREEEERMRREEEERKKKEEERKKMEERIRMEEEERKRKEEKMRREEEEKKKKKEEERKKMEIMRKEEEERMRREEEKKKKKQEEEKAERVRAEEKRRVETEKKLAEEKKMREEEERKRAAEEEKRRQRDEEEERMRVERKRKEEEEERMRVERKRKEEEEERMKAERKRKEEEEERMRAERKRKEEEEEQKRLHEEELKKREERMRLEEERKERQMREERERRRAEEEEERRKDEEEQEKREREVKEDEKPVAKSRSSKVRQETRPEGPAPAPAPGPGPGPGPGPVSTDPHEELESSPVPSAVASPPAAAQRSARVSAVKPSVSVCKTVAQSSMVNTNPFLDDCDLEDSAMENHNTIKGSTEKPHKKARAPLPPHNKPQVSGEVSSQGFREKLLEETHHHVSKQPTLTVSDGLMVKMQTDRSTREQKTTEEVSPSSYNELDSTCNQRMTTRPEQGSSAQKMDSNNEGIIEQDKVVSQSQRQSGKDEKVVAKHNKGPAPSKPSVACTPKMKPVTKDKPSVHGTNQTGTAEDPDLKASDSSHGETKAAPSSCILQNTKDFAMKDTKAKTVPVEDATQNAGACKTNTGLLNTVSLIPECEPQGVSKKKSRAPLPPGKPNQVREPKVTSQPPSLAMVPGNHREKDQEEEQDGDVGTPPSLSVSFSEFTAFTEKSQDMKAYVGVTAGTGPRPLPLARVVPTDAQPVLGNSSTGELGPGGAPPSVISRAHAVKPLSAADRQTDPKQTADHRPAAGPDNVQDKPKGVEVVTGSGAYSQLTQAELISLVVRQQEQLSQRESRILELEQYIDNLLVRIMEERPNILMSVNSQRKAV